MGLSLFNRKIKDTFPGLLKTTDNAAIGVTPKSMTDGLGNNAPFSIGTSSVEYTGTQDFTSATVVGITSPAVTGVYVIKLGMSGTNISSIAAAQDPLGQSLIGNPNWNIVIVASDHIRISHNLSRFAINVMTHASRNDAGKYISRPITGASSTTNSVIQDGNIIDIDVINSFSTGFVSGGDYIYITWQFPDYDFTAV